jgi:hypothetical protein
MKALFYSNLRLNLILIFLMLKLNQYSLAATIRIFLWLRLPGRILALGSAQTLTEMITRDISSGVKAIGA